MPLIRVRKAGQVTLPLAMCRALDLKEYDYLDATVAAGSIILKPMAVFARQPGWRDKLTKDAPQRSKGGNRRLPTGPKSGSAQKRNQNPRDGSTR
jgi:bifunctional DNA-binding transcriptional regulator/antitoxin component of YhaV-PrlF toxin-antitoxin module